MSRQAWVIFAALWAIFAASLGTNPAKLPSPRRLYLPAVTKAMITFRSEAVYLVAFGLFIPAGIALTCQVWAIIPTAVGLSMLCYMGYCALGAGPRQNAFIKAYNSFMRRFLAVYVIPRGLLSGSMHGSKGAAL